MKLIIAIVQDQDAPGLVDDLMEREYREASCEREGYLRI